MRTFVACAVVAHAGVADALEKKFLESLQFGISHDPEGSQLLEASLQIICEARLTDQAHQNMGNI